MDIITQLTIMEPRLLQTDILCSDVIQIRVVCHRAFIVFQNPCHRVLVALDGPASLQAALQAVCAQLVMRNLI